jgi:hypothetical protein
LKLTAYKTITENNKPVLLASDDCDVMPETPTDWIQFLYETEDSLNVCWNLEATVAPLLKMLGKELCEKLYKETKCFCRPFSIFYIPSKVFSIKPVFSHKRTNLYDISQYYPDLKEPDSVTEIEKLGHRLMEALAKMNLYPTKLSSPITIYEQCVMSHLNLPTWLDMPDEACEFAINCSNKLWIEAYQIGYFGNAFDYDMTASFPSIAKDLKDIRKCEWVSSDKYRTDAVYGYLKGKVTIYNWVKVSPIIYIDDNGRLSTPTGTWETYLTMDEWLFIFKNGIGKFELEEGWWAIPKDFTWALHPPLEIVMERLLAYKDHSDELVRMLAKRMSVGVYGKFGEEYENKFGKHHNPCWFAEISTKARLKVAEFIYKHQLQNNLIHVSVDGVLLDAKVEDLASEK